MIASDLHLSQYGVKIHIFSDLDQTVTVYGYTAWVQIDEYGRSGNNDFTIACKLSKKNYPSCSRALGPTYQANNINPVTQSLAV